LILLHQLNDIQGELTILHSNGSPGFSTQGEVLGMGLGLASHKLGKESWFRSAMFVKTLMEQKCLQKNKFFVSIRLLYPLNNT
jgi:hypothetical protein